MAIQDTNVAGVTFYKTDFNSIKKSSKVHLKPNPNNKYDCNAIEVWIDGSLVGHIKKDINQAILKHIYNGEEVTAKVKNIVGGNNGKNYGIVISIKKSSHSNFGENKGDYLGPPKDEVSISRSENMICISDEGDITWEEYLEEEKGLQVELVRPKKPNCHQEYIENSNFIERFFNNKEIIYSEELITNWEKECTRVEVNNMQRVKNIKSFNKKTLRKEYEKYNEKRKIELIFDKQRVSIASKEENESAQKDGYITLYENIIFEKLRNKYTCFQQATIGKSSFDILLLSKKNKCLWVIEVDGIIHRFSSIYEKDQRNATELLKDGFSLIRIPNYLVKNYLHEIVDIIMNEVE